MTVNFLFQSPTSQPWLYPISDIQPNLCCRKPEYNQYSAGRRYSINLNEVVVTALGIKREEKALGYAVQKVGGDNFSTIKPVDVATSLTGKVAGLNIQNSPEFNSAPSISLRGSEPLLVIDGVPYGNVSLKDIAADDIESVDVLKGATASAPLRSTWWCWGNHGND